MKKIDLSDYNRVVEHEGKEFYTNVEDENKANEILVHDDGGWWLLDISSYAWEDAEDIISAVMSEFEAGRCEQVGLTTYAYLSLPKLNSYEGENLWNDVIEGLAGADWDASCEASNDSTVVVFEDGSRAEWDVVSQEWVEA